MLKLDDCPERLLQYRVFQAVLCEALIFVLLVFMPAASEGLLLDKHSRRCPIVMNSQL